MAKLHSYLNFHGNTEEAFNFYKSVFGGEFVAVIRFRDVGDAFGGENKIPEGDLDKIMHIALPIGGDLLMATDALESMGQKLETGNNSYIYVAAENREEADRLFNGLSDGGKIEMPISDTFWGAYFGSLADKFGVQWMVSYDAKQS